MQKYTTIARWYDALSAEPVYGAGRRRAVPALGLRTGDRVLDVGCGTGLNLPLLSAAVGARGLVVGVDMSAEMLGVARAKATSSRRTEARFVEADATRLTPDDLQAAGLERHELFDAAIFTYSLSLMSDPDGAWRAVRTLLRPGAGVGVVDMQPPTGTAAVLTPLARLACRVAGSDITARPWLTVEADLTDVRRWTLRGGHIQVSVGRLAAGREGWRAAAGLPDRSH